MSFLNRRKRAPAREARPPATLAPGSGMAAPHAGSGLDTGLIAPRTTYPRLNAERRPARVTR